jgi:tellurite resistance protein TehA-like permease
MDFGSDLRKQFRTTLIITGSLLASIFFYAVLVGLIKTQMRPFQGVLVPGLSRQTLRYLFYGAAAAAVVLVRFVGRAMLRVAPGEGAPHLIARLGRAATMTAALGEIPALLGFALFLLTGLSRDFYVLAFVSLFVEFMYFPRLRVWQDIVRERHPQVGL